MPEDIYYKDIKIDQREFDTPVSDRSRSDIVLSEGDFDTVSGRENLAQALISRLMTRTGELAELGHPDYGSRLYELKGQPNNERTHRLAEMFIREALNDETRIEEIINIEISERRREMLSIKIEIKAIDGNNLTLTLNQGLV